MKIEHVCFEYGARTIFSNLSFDIEQGLLLVSGPSGCGKSTLLDLLLGYLSPSSGTIEIEKGIAPGDETRKNLVAYAGERPTLLSSETIEENLSFFYPDEACRKRTVDLLHAFNLQHFEKTLLTMSGGERKKAEVAFALASDKDIVLLDEPFAGIDAKSIPLLKKAIRERKGIVIVVDHLGVFSDVEADATLRFDNGNWTFDHKRIVGGPSLDKSETTVVSFKDCWQKALRSFNLGVFKNVILAFFSVLCVFVFSFGFATIDSTSNADETRISYSCSSSKYFEALVLTDKGADSFALYRQEGKPYYLALNMVDHQDYGTYAQDRNYTLFVSPLCHKGEAYQVQDRYPTIDSLFYGKGESIPVSSMAFSDMNGKLLESGFWFNDWFRQPSDLLLVSAADFEDILSSGGLSLDGKNPLYLSLGSRYDATENILYFSEGHLDGDPYFELVDSKDAFVYPTVKEGTHVRLYYGEQDEGMNPPRDTGLALETTGEGDGPALSLENYLLLSSQCFPASNALFLPLTSLSDFKGRDFSADAPFADKFQEDTTWPFLLCGLFLALVLLLVVFFIRKNARIGTYRQVLSIHGMKERNIDKAVLVASCLVALPFLFLGLLAYGVSLVGLNFLLQYTTLLQDGVLGTYGNLNPLFSAQTSPIPFYRFGWPVLFLLVLYVFLVLLLFFLSVRSKRRR